MTDHRFVDTIVSEGPHHFTFREELFAENRNIQWKIVFRMKEERRHGDVAKTQDKNSKRNSFNFS
jgi:hypothetical protein